MNRELPEQKSLLDRVVKVKDCTSGILEDLSPSAFEWKKGDVGLSFTDRNQMTPRAAIKRFNKTHGISEEYTGRWTVAISWEEAISIADYPSDVYFDDPVNDPEHVLLILPREMTTKTQKRVFRESLCTLAKGYGRELYI